MYKKITFKKSGRVSFGYFKSCPYCGYAGSGWKDSGECPNCGETS